MFGFGRRREPRLVFGNDFYEHFGQHDAQLYAVIIGIGIPILGTLRYWGVSILMKLAIAASVFLIVQVAYWVTEIGWIVAEIRLKNRLVAEDVVYQEQTMQAPYWGVAAAVVIWIASWIPGQTLTPYFGYGPIEWIFVIENIAANRLVINIVYNLIAEYQNAFGNRARFDQADVSH